MTRPMLGRSPRRCSGAPNSSASTWPAIGEAAAHVQPYVRVDGTKAWSLMQLERQLRPQAYERVRGGYIARPLGVRVRVGTCEAVPRMISSRIRRS